MQAKSNTLSSLKNLDKTALFTSPVRISISREESDVEISDEGIALAIAEEKSGTDGSLAGGRKLTEEVNKADKIGPEKRFGTSIPLYALHSKTTYGIGEYLKLIKFFSWLNSIEFSLVQLSPIYDKEGQPPPYLPFSPFSLNPLDPSSRLCKIFAKSGFYKADNRRNDCQPKDEIIASQTLKEEMQACIE